MTEAVKAAKGGQIEFRVEKAGIIHAGIGKRSFEAAKLRENFMTMMEILIRAKPASSKGKYVKSITLSLSHSPGVRVDINEVTNEFRTA